jgi:hypothetical protein
VDEDFEGNTGSLTKTALRETREEIGWAPHRLDDVRAPFLGAAFSLLRGRDLNFYCHFDTHGLCEKSVRVSDMAVELQDA